MLSKYHLKLLHPKFFLFRLNKKEWRNRENYYFCFLVGISVGLCGIIGTFHNWILSFWYLFTVALFVRSHRRSRPFHCRSADNSIERSHLAKLLPIAPNSVSIHSHPNATARCQMETIEEEENWSRTNDEVISLFSRRGCGWAICALRHYVFYVCEMCGVL